MELGVKQVIVGQFFEAVGHKVLGGALSRDENGDICLWRSSTAVEVKASGYQSSYGFRLDLKQISDYEGLTGGFPFERAWYLFFAYRNTIRANKRTGKRSTELSKHDTASSVCGYLAGATMWGVLLDLSIISRLKDTKRISTKSVMGHLGTQTIDLKCRAAHHLANGGMEEGLTDLGLDPKQFGVLTSAVRVVVNVGGTKHRLNFPLVSLLRKEEIVRVQRRLRRRGFATTKGTG